MTVTRRSVLLASAAAPAAGALPDTPAGAAEAGAAASGRRTVPLRDGWRFALADLDGGADPTGQDVAAAAPGHDDSAWRTVAVPHDWSIEQTPTTEHGTTAGTGFFPGGLGWYRLAFTLPPAHAGRRISVEFDGVYMDSTVWCNGTEAGRHPYGYTGFALDLTGLLHTDGTTANVIAVRVRNRLPSSRWYSGSGIYREARLVITDPVHVDRWGTAVTTPEVTAGRALVRVATTVVNTAAAAADVGIVSRVLAPNGRTVARTSSMSTVTDRATETHELTVPEPLLWDFATPRRYTLETELRVAGRRTDTYRTPFGIRTVRFDPDEGFHLNGRYAKIKGVDLHHDLGALGAAVSEDAIRRQMTIMKSMGVNAFRTSHNPPSPEMIRVCEELGIVMLVEAFDCWKSPKTRYDYGRFFEEWADRDVAEMVLAARNSPAVVLWSIGNEISEFTSSAGLAMADRLIAAVKAHDATRPVVIGSHRHRSVPVPGSPADLILAKIDGLGLNYNTAKSVDALHARYPKLFLFESESSSETSTRGAYQEPEHLNTGENHTPGRRATSSYDNNLASWTMSGEYGHKKDRDRRWFAGQFLWSGIDYLGEPTPYDVFPVKASFFGAVDTAGFPKDMYHLFRSQWTDGPMVHLLPATWNHEPGATVEVWAYANVETVELFLNGTSLGTRTFDTKTTADGRTYLETTEATGDDKTVTDGPCPGSYTSPGGGAGKLHLTWKVAYEPGTLKAVARRDGRVVATDVLRTAGAPHAVRLTADRETLAADGRSLLFVTADVVDARGVVVPDAGHLLSFAVSGGSLAGLDNGRQESAERYQAATRTAFHGKALAVVRSGTRAGTLKVTACSAGLRTGSVTVRTTRARSAATTPAAVLGPGPRPAPAYPHADAGYSGRPDTLPAAMLDGDPATGWSNAFTKAATALLPAFGGARPEDWVSVDWGRARDLDRVAVSFTVDATHSLPARVEAAVWDGERYVPVTGAAVEWAAASDAPTLVTFDPVRGSRLRLTLTSAAPGTTRGAVRISRLEV